MRGKRFVLGAAAGGLVGQLGDGIHRRADGGRRAHGLDWNALWLQLLETARIHIETY